MADETIRAHSKRIAGELGYIINDNLPLLEENEILRDLNIILDRLLGLHVLAACAVGFDRMKGCLWLEREHLLETLSSKERCFLFDGLGEPKVYIDQIESMWALAWALDYIADLKFTWYCDPRFVSIFPDLHIDQPSGSFRKKATLRPKDEIYEMADLVYCLHWSVVDAQLRGLKMPGYILPYAIIERRRALDWMMSDEDWEDISLDT